MIITEENWWNYHPGTDCSTQWIWWNTGITIRWSVSLKHLSLYLLYDYQSIKCKKLS